MAIPTILKKKSFYVILAVLLLGGYWFWSRAQAAGKITYETSIAEQRTLLQTVEVTGEIKPASRIDLSFKSGGTLERVTVKVGDNVKQGDVLVQLEDHDLTFSFQRSAAALSMAQANLNARLAGETSQSIRVAQAQLEQAQAAYDKAVSDLENAKIQNQTDSDSANLAVQTARNNYDNAGTVSDQSYANQVETARVSLLTALGPMNSGLVDGDTISGVDDTATNQMYKIYLGALNDGTLVKAKNSYTIAKNLKIDAETTVKSITTQSSKEDVLAATEKMQKAIEAIQSYLLDVKIVLSNTITSTYFTSTDLSAKKSLIDSDYTSVGAQKSTVVAARQAVELGKISNVSDKTKLEDALKTAKLNLQSAQTGAQIKLTNAQTNVAVQKAAVDSAQAALELKQAPPRAVDVASLRAAVQDAQAAYAQAQENLNKVRVLAPVDGTISDVVSDVGELIAANTPQIRMVGTSQYDVEAKVPEADIAKIKVSQDAVFTLDAYGDDVKLKGTVTAIEPDQTKVQDAVYYKIHVTVAPTDKVVKPGMTANVTVTTGSADNAVIIPLRAVKTVGDQKKVRILVNGKPVEKTITLGLKGDEGKTQVLTGLQKGDEVILSEKTGS